MNPRSFMRGSSTVRMRTIISAKVQLRATGIIYYLCDLYSGASYIPYISVVHTSVVFMLDLYIFQYVRI